MRKFNPTIGKYEMLKATLPTLKVWKLIANTWRVVFDAPHADLCSCNRNRRVKELEMAFELMKEQFEPKEESIEEETDKVSESDELLELVVGKDKKVKSISTKKK